MIRTASTTIWTVSTTFMATSKTILKAFGLTEDNVKYRIEEISKRLETGN